MYSYHMLWMLTVQEMIHCQDMAYPDFLLLAQPTTILGQVVMNQLHNQQCIVSYRFYL